MRRIALVVSVLIGLALGANTAAAVPRPYQNCGQLNARYPHGLGRANARDEVKGLMIAPVTNFKRSTALYLRAMSFNKGLDRDHDGIACEKQS